MQDKTKQGDEASQAQVESVGDDAATQARNDYESALKERDARIAELEGEIARAAKSAEIGELRRKGDEQRVGFELKLAGAQREGGTGPACRPRQRHREAEGDEAVAVRRGRDDETLARDCLPRWRGQGVDPGQHHLIRKELHGDPKRGLQARLGVGPPDVGHAHGARRALHLGDHDSQDRGHGPGELRPQLQAQDELDRLRVQDQDIQLRPRHQATRGGSRMTSAHEQAN